jgi:hypothetical protein
VPKEQLEVNSWSTWAAYGQKKTKQEESKAVTHLIERRIRELEEKRQNLLEAHVYRRTIEPEYVRLFREIVLDFFECPARV